MPLDAPVSRVLKDALDLPPGKPFEQCVGQSVRRHGGTYEDYVELIGRVRETARTHKVSLRDAARLLRDQP